MRPPKNLPLSKCPTCGYSFNDATMIGDEYAVPRPGDLSVCFKCGEALVFQPDLSLVIADLDSFEGLEPVEHDLMSSLQFKIRKERPLG